MKLLFDQNLSPRIAAILAKEFPGSAHVVQLGLDARPDIQVWNYAKDHGYCLVSKDSDFGDWAQLLGYPPALVWLRVGNCSTRDLITKLRLHREKICRLGMDGEPWVLVIF